MIDRHLIGVVALTQRGRVTHICVGKQTIIGSDNGLSPGRRQAIIWTNAGTLLIGLLGINFSENLIRIQTFSFTKMHLKMSSAKWLLFCLDLNELNQCWFSIDISTQRYSTAIRENSTWFILITALSAIYFATINKLTHALRWCVWKVL